jgi:hypothetical protein
LPEDVQRAISGLEIIQEANGQVKYKYKFWDKGRSLERLEKYLGMFEKDNLQSAPKIEGCTFQVVKANHKEDDDT